MRKALALLAITTILAEVPSCNGKDDIGEGGVAASPEKTSAQSPKPLNPHITRDDRKHTITFQADWAPGRKMIISWSIDGRKNNLVKDASPFMHTRYDAAQGSSAILVVTEARGGSGYKNCRIYLDDKLVIPKTEDPWDPWMQRRDEQDCIATLIVP